MPVLDADRDREAWGLIHTVKAICVCRQLSVGKAAVAINTNFRVGSMSPVKKISMEPTLWHGSLPVWGNLLDGAMQWKKVSPVFCSGFRAAGWKFWQIIIEIKYHL